MTSKKQNSRNRPVESRLDRDQELTDWARRVKRKGWGKIDRELSEAFTPRLKDDQDLRWYFNRGPDGDRDGTPEMLKRWRRVDRCLDGWGHALMLHYLGKKDLIPDYQQHSLLRQLASEYRQYLRNTVKGYGAANWEPHCVVPSAKLRSLIHHARPAYETVSRSTFHGERTYLAQRRRDEEPGLELLPRDIPTSTWGDHRLNPDHVRLTLEMACGVPYVRAHAMAWIDAVELLKTKLSSLPENDPLHAHAFDEREEPASAKKGKARLIEDLESVKQENVEIRELHDPARARSATARSQREFISQWTGTTGYALAPGTWDPRKVEVNNGSPTTTVSEIANRLGIGSKWVRAALLSLQCPGIQFKSSAIPIEWFKSDKGRDFWKQAERQQGKQILDRDAAARLVRGATWR